MRGHLRTFYAAVEHGFEGASLPDFVRADREGPQRRIYRGKHDLRLVIHDEDTAVPLVQAKLNATERHALRKALAPGK